MPPTSHHFFHFTPVMMKNIKEAATCGGFDKDGVNEFSYVSTIDAITALFTVLISRARGHGEDVRVMNAMNARRRLGLPANYAGNVVCSAMATYNASELQSGDEIMTAVSPSNARKAGSTPATIDCTE
ncbi:unnamed protein product [Peronospora belbahrii]|uniref:Uncharacterized protein n=1 Tax=Peronospora belbahrii TaxID=622444 RepID=A0AAU9LH01_9STRA|nr:unnamed protein product [Peronospora belbahrii]